MALHLRNMGIPRQLLRELYDFGSLHNSAAGVAFALKNRLLDAELVAIHAVAVDGEALRLADVVLCSSESSRPATELSQEQPLRLALRDRLTVEVNAQRLQPGQHELSMEFEVKGLGRQVLTVEDVLRDGEQATHGPIPHDEKSDYTQDLVQARQRFVEEHSGVALEHTKQFSFDPSRMRGNIENFTGVAQVPVGFAGPLKVNGEHANGEFVVPMATTEGTLVASYNRGIKVLNLAGGVLTTISEDRMQRAPVFIFDSARDARAFRDFVQEHQTEIAREAEATSQVAKLLCIETYLSNRFAFLRFNYSTGDAAGQNMVGRATFAACRWILDQARDVRGFYLEANLATDKKHSHINILHTRGKRVTAEATVPREVLVQHLRVTPQALNRHAGLGTVGAILSGASNNGAHSPNGIAAMFIATGQDVANVAESSAAILHTEVTAEGDLYAALTIPSLIVATHGGGTGLPTQHECLQVLGCTGPGSARKLAEVIAAVALAGELSLGAAISSLDWVSSHERLGRNR